MTSTNQEQPDLQKGSVTSSLQTQTSHETFREMNKRPTSKNSKGTHPVIIMLYFSLLYLIAYTNRQTETDTANWDRNFDPTTLLMLKSRQLTNSDSEFNRSEEQSRERGDASKRPISQRHFFFSTNTKNPLNFLRNQTGPTPRKLAFQPIWLNHEQNSTKQAHNTTNPGTKSFFHNSVAHVSSRAYHGPDNTIYLR